MTLANVEVDHGRALAPDVARTWLVFMCRSGSPAQISVPLAVQGREIGSHFGPLHEWAITKAECRDAL